MTTPLFSNKLLFFHCPAASRVATVSTHINMTSFRLKKGIQANRNYFLHLLYLFFFIIHVNFPKHLESVA